MVENPYRGDRLSKVFVGRAELLKDLEGTIRRRGAICPIMGGRGIGKSAVARELGSRLGDFTVVRSEGGVDDARHAMESVWPSMVGADFVASLTDEVRKIQGPGAVLVLDEIERVLEDRDRRGIALLDNLRKVFEEAEGRFSVVVLGGTDLRNLLVDTASPFLGKARIRRLTGLSLAETRQLIEEPLSLHVRTDAIDALWDETAGHPRVLQLVMEAAVDRWNDATTEVAFEEHILCAVVEVRQKWLDAEIYRHWWRNLQPDGQRVYRAMLRKSSAPIASGAWLATFGDDPRAWVEVAESTGVALLTSEGVLPRGSGFASWVGDNFATEPTGSTAPLLLREPHLEAWLEERGGSSLERCVLTSLSRWAKRTVEFPGLLLKGTADRGNSLFVSEHTLRLSALMALTQQDELAMVEPEALSAGRETRADLKIRWREDREVRACIEFKIYGRNDFKDVVRQAIGYAIPQDTFTVVVSADRTSKGVADYRTHCIEGAAPTHEAMAPEGIDYPHAVTTHTRTNGSPIRVWHIFLRLPGDRS